MIRLFLRTLCMIEYVQTRVSVNNITTFTVINGHWEGGDHTSPWNEVHTADKFSMFDLSVQKKQTNSEWNSVTVFFNLRMSNFGRHERYDVPRCSDGEYLRCSVTPHKFINTGRGSSIGSESAWHASGPEFDPHVRYILSWRLGHENISTAILPLPLIQEEQLSVTGERMCTKYW